MNKLMQITLIIIGGLFLSLQSFGNDHGLNKPTVTMTLNMDSAATSAADRELWKRIRDGKPLSMNERISLIGKSYTIRMPGQVLHREIKNYDDVKQFFRTKKDFSRRHIVHKFRFPGVPSKVSPRGKGGLIIMGTATILAIGTGQSDAAVTDDGYVENEDRAGITEGGDYIEFQEVGAID